MRSTRKPPSTLGRRLAGGRRIPFSVLRLTNTYGPGQPTVGPGAGFAGNFLDRALAGDEIVILGNPALRRDLNHVDDVVDAFLRAGAAGAPAGTWNLGAPPTTLGDFAAAIFRALGMPPRIRVKPLPAGLASIAVGDFHSDWSAIRADLGWGTEGGPAERTHRHRPVFPGDPGRAVTIPFQRLAAAEDAGVREALQGVLASGSFALGPEVERFESAFARTLGVAHGVGVASGTDAITLALRALGIGPGDRVLTTAFSTGYTALGILRAGARPVFGDVERGSLCLAAASVERALEGGGIAAILPVHLFGAAAAGWKDLVEVAARHGVPILEDACQAHGAHFRGQPLGSFGAASAFSFYPTKNLGALGDAGLVATPEAGLAARLRRLRSGGQTRRHHHAAAGWNSRLDELQAAVLSSRLPGLPAANRIRRRLARRYREALLGLPLGFATPGPEVESAWHLFVVRTAERGRAAPASRHRRRRNARPLSGNAPAPGGVLAVRGGRRNLSGGGTGRRRSSQPAAPSAPCGQRGGTGGGRGAFVLRRSAVVAGVRIGRWRSGAPAPCSVRAAESWWEQGTRSVFPAAAGIRASTASPVCSGLMAPAS